MGFMKVILVIWFYMLLQICNRFLHYYPLTNEYKLPHKYFIISPVDIVLELPMPILQTMMLLKNSKHYDGLIFKSIFFFIFKSIFVFHFQVSCLQTFQRDHMQNFTIHNILPLQKVLHALKTQDNKSNWTWVSYITNWDNLFWHCY